ncbi:substrate-binding domain-containing protein [Streptacidiphilus cavernicola]|uniref:Substrate-binding domain-containing protein n=1 Tax=Streptacidiphilus cavernicola TaxID=3342716 RepID=A0ABV6W4B3_9ACTN
MNTSLRRTVVATAAISMALGMAACGKAGSSSSSSASSSSTASAASGGSQIIGLLLPETKTTRYETFDKPLIEAKIKELAPNAQVKYYNANASAATQAQQVTTAINQGAKVLIVDAVDSTQIQSSIQQATAKGIKVLAYDRLASGPVSAYVSFDNETVGKLQGQGLLDALGAKAVPTAKIIEIDGDSADPNAADFKKGFQETVKGKLTIAYDESGKWDPTVAAQQATAGIAKVGAKNIAGFYSANDGMAAGIVASMKTAGLSKLPIGGQDAQLDAIQRIIAGTQAYTIYKAYAPEADAAATLAVDLLNGTDVSSVATATKTNGSGNSVPSDLLTPVLITKANIESTIVADKFYTVDQICTSEFAAACTAAGIK